MDPAAVVLFRRRPCRTGDRGHGVGVSRGTSASRWEPVEVDLALAEAAALVALVPARKEEVPRTRATPPSTHSTELLPLLLKLGEVADQGSSPPVMADHCRARAAVTRS